MPKADKLLILVMVALLTSRLVCRAQAANDASEPAVVLDIQKECDAIDRQAQQWKTFKTSGICEEMACGDSTVYVDPQGKIRKIITSMEGDDYEGHHHLKWARYYDEEEQAIFCSITHHILSESGTPPEQHPEGRYYFRDGKLVAYHDTGWINPDNPAWGNMLDIQNQVKAVMGKAVELMKNNASGPN